MFNERVIAHGPWSISKANMLGLCSKQYLHKYVEKLPETRKSTQAMGGVAAHTLQEMALRTPTQTGDDLRMKVGEIIEKDGLTHAESGEITAKIPAVLDFTDRIQKFKKANNVTLELIEHKLAIDANGNGVDFFDNKNAIIRGVIDYAALTADGILMVVDHKSGRKKPIKEHSTQFYAYMAMSIGNFGEHEVRGVQSAINYFGEPRLDWFPRLNGQPGPWSRAEIQSHVLPWLEAYLNKLTRKLVLVDERTPEATTGWQCEYCGYANLCEQGTAMIEQRKAKRVGGRINT